MAQKHYDEAIRLLAEIIRRDPEMFDAAQQLLERIRRVQDSFNARYEELLTVLYEQRDVEKALAIIDELEALDPNPNKATRDAIAQAKRGALVQANRNRFDALMDRALGQLEGGDIDSALETYLGAFALHREEFEASSLGNVVKDSVHTALDAVRSAVASYRELTVALEAENRTLAEAAGRGEQDLQRLAAAQRERLSRMASFAAAVRDAAGVLTRQRQGLPSGSEASGYHLYYAEKAILGRVGRESREGIGHAQAVGLEREARSALASLRQSVEAARKGAFAAYGSGDWAQAERDFAALRPASRTLLQFAYLHDAGGDLEASYDPMNAAKLILRADLPAFLEAQSWYREHEAYLTLAAARRQAEAARTASGWEPSRLTVAVASVEALAREWAQYVAELRAASPQLGREAQGVLAAAAAALRDWREGTYAAFAGPLAEAERETSEQEALLRDGRTQTLADGTVRTVFRPDLALAEFRSLQVRTREISEGVAAARQAAVDPVSLGETGALVAAADVALVGLQDRATALLARLERDIAEANSRVLAADGLRKQGDAEYRAAQAALGRRQYAEARSSLAAAAETYARSLDIRDDPEVRDLRDRVLPALLAQVNEAENNQVIADVRRLIDEAVAAYRRTEFARAKAALLQALARWKDTHTEPNAEIDTWLALVERALTTQEGWELVETQPRYREIAQLLKFASDDFARGEVLEAQKQPAEAQLAFTAAQEKLDTINKAVPRLKTANFLRLKITQKLEPEVFRRQLADVKARARSALAVGSGTSLNQIYSELADFAQIVTGDRELAAIMQQVEVAIGRRPAPPDPQRLERSRTAYLEAKRIYDNRLSELYSEAVRLCDEAIAANPDSRDAAVLKDAILIRTGAERQDIIATDDRREYLRAERLFSEGNYPEAYNIVQLLLRKPTNRNYPPLLELNEKLKKRLNIP